MKLEMAVSTGPTWVGSTKEHFVLVEKRRERGRRGRKAGSTRGIPGGYRTKAGRVNRIPIDETGCRGGDL